MGTDSGLAKKVLFGDNAAVVEAAKDAFIT